MKVLDRLLKPTAEQRYTVDDWADDYFTYLGTEYMMPGGMQTTWGASKAETIEGDFVGYVQGALKANGIISAIELFRSAVFAEARFQFQAMRNGRPGELWGDGRLAQLERPWVGGTTGDLLARMLIDADLAGNSYWTILDGDMVRLRPDWVDIVWEYRYARRGNPAAPVGKRRLGYIYNEGGRNSDAESAAFLVDEVAHFAPYPDPEATWRGMSWLTPVIREIQADKQATDHKLKFFENAATPNLAVSLAKEITPEQFDAFIERMEKQHKGVRNAYRTLYTAGGADVTVVGANLQQLDFKVTQGAGETRIAAAAGIHPVILGLSEGLAGSSLNAGNYAQARRRVTDGTMFPLWRNASGSLETLVRPTSGSRLWFDVRDVRFLREDEKDQAEIQGMQAQTVRNLTDAGYTPDSVKRAVLANDFALLEHSGLFSVQLQPPGTTAAPAAPPAADEEGNTDA